MIDKLIRLVVTRVQNGVGHTAPYGIPETVVASISFGVLWFLLGPIREGFCCIRPALYRHAQVALVLGIRQVDGPRLYRDLAPTPTLATDTGRRHVRLHIRLPSRRTILSAGQGLVWSEALYFWG